MKKIVGRKRHFLVDFTGLILVVLVTTANVQDRDGAKSLLGSVRRRFPRLRVIFADGGYAGDLIRWVKRNCRCLLKTILRSAETVGFVVLPKRWVVERTFAWLTKYRRLAKDYEAQIWMSETMIYAAMIHRMARRLEKL